MSRNYDHPFSFREGPVPHTGMNYWGGYWFRRWHRNPRTTQERRFNAIHGDYVRPRRRLIPHAWDDVPRADVRVKQSWKKCRKRKQWM